MNLMLRIKVNFDIAGFWGGKCQKNEHVDVKLSKDKLIRVQSFHERLRGWLRSHMLASFILQIANYKDRASE